MTTHGPLSGIKVVDWTIWQFGPVCTMMLGDLGAEVIKIEARNGDPGRAMRTMTGVSTALAGGRVAYFEGNNRNKKSITVDLTKPEGREIVYKLVKGADVFVQNFRTGVADRMGLGYEKLKEINPRIIYAAGNGLGPKGPDATRPAYDGIGQARGGMMYAAIPAGADPRMVGGGVADQMGGIMMAFGVIAALCGRELHGVGQKVDVSHLGSVVWLQGLAVSTGLLNKTWRPPADRTTAANPMVNTYKCKDGKWITFMNLQADRYWPDFCRNLGLERLIEDPKYATMQARAQNARELIAIIDAQFLTKDSKEWEGIMSKGGDMIFSLVQQLSDLETDPQIIANEYIKAVDHPVLGKIKLANHPIHYSETPSGIYSTAPELGEHTEDVLLSLGYEWEDIAKLRDAEVI
jgi:crotonobetainyl-CoA:carnitine CoA-transferase CaiB-like acyl-CoA transferase